MLQQTISIFNENKDQNEPVQSNLIVTFVQPELKHIEISFQQIANAQAFGNFWMSARTFASRLSVTCLNQFSNHFFAYLDNLVPPSSPVLHCFPTPTINSSNSSINTEVFWYQVPQTIDDFKLDDTLANFIAQNCGTRVSMNHTIREPVEGARRNNDYRVGDRYLRERSFVIEQGSPYYVFQDQLELPFPDVITFEDSSSISSRSAISTLNNQNSFPTKQCVFKSTYTWKDAFRMFNENQGMELIFSFQDDDRQEYAHGDGANRYVYHKIANSLLDCGILKRTDDFRVEFSDLKFVCTDYEFYGFACLIHYSAKNKALLPFHLPVYLLFCLSGDEWISDEQCKLLFQASHKETWKQIENLTEQELGELLENENPMSHADYIRHALFTDENETVSLLYSKIDNYCYTLHPRIREMTVLELDQYFSGEYSIGAEAFLNICNLDNECDQNLKSNWETFIRLCSEKEIVQILLLFTNSLSLTPIYFHIGYDQEQDIVIFTCMGSVSIKKSILEKVEHLAVLKSYFINNDTISDGNIQNESISDIDEIDE